MRGGRLRPCRRRSARDVPPEMLPERLQAAVAGRVRWVTIGRHYNVGARSFLRQTAWETWDRREGTCGDGARLIVALLEASGTRAARINLVHDQSGFGHTALSTNAGDAGTSSTRSAVRLGSQHGPPPIASHSTCSCGSPAAVRAAAALSPTTPFSPDTASTTLRASQAALLLSTALPLRRAGW